MPSIDGRKRNRLRRTSGIKINPANRARQKAIWIGVSAGSSKWNAVGAVRTRVKKLPALQSTAARMRVNRANAGESVDIGANFLF